MKFKSVSRGLVHVYTGEGKGKTTAALGLAVRAISYGKRVLIVQFIKGPWRSGELNIVDRLQPYLTVRALGEGFIKILGDRKPFSQHQHAAENAFSFAEKSLRSGRYDILILDEINVAVVEKLIALRRLVKLVRNKPEHVELVLTGRGASEKIMQLADYVSVIEARKHPFQKGILARPAIDY